MTTPYIPSSAFEVGSYPGGEGTSGLQEFTRQLLNSLKIAINCSTSQLNSIRTHMYLRPSVLSLSVFCLRLKSGISNWEATQYPKCKPATRKIPWIS